MTTNTNPVSSYHKTMTNEIMKELNERIDKAQEEDDIDGQYALNSFREWFCERYIY